MNLNVFAPLGLMALLATTFATVATARPRDLVQVPADIPENVQVSQVGAVPGASRPVEDFSEVHLAASPVDGQHLLGSSKFFFDSEHYGFYTGVFESLDGGATWTQGQPAGVEAYNLTSDPVNAFDHQGNGYFTLLTRGPTGLDMLRKPRGGSWEAPVTVDRTTVTDKQWIAADQDPGGKSRFPGRLYMSWTDVATPSRILVARSEDGNRTWSGPAELDAGSLQGSAVAAGPDGTVHVIYGRDIFGTAVDGAILATRSGDGGVTWSAPVQAAESVSIPGRLDEESDFRTPASLPALAVSPTTGTLVAAWADYRSGDADILVARSADGGRTWSATRRVNTDGLANGIDQIQPQLAAAPDGRLAIAWLDRRHFCPDLRFIPLAHVGKEDFCLDVYLSRSRDDGATWEPEMRVSAQTWDWTLSLPRDGSGNGFIGDYIGLASTLGYDYPFWSATADLGQNPGHRQQAFVARVPAAPLPVDLSGSTLTVEPRAAAPGTAVTVSLRLENRGTAGAASVTAELPLPDGLELVAGSAEASAGTLEPDPGGRGLAWRGAIAAGAAVTLSYRAVVEAASPEGRRMEVAARMTDDAGRRYVRGASLLVSLPPTLVRASPADGGRDVGAGTVIILTFSEPMEPLSLRVTTDPDLGPDAWELPAWTRDRRSATLRHKTPFEAGRTYRVTVRAQDPSGLDLAPGPVPNPWSFTVESAPPTPQTGGERLYLPWLERP